MSDNCGKGISQHWCCVAYAGVDPLTGLEQRLVYDGAVVSAGQALLAALQRGAQPPGQPAGAAPGHALSAQGLAMLQGITGTLTEALGLIARGQELNQAAWDAAQQPDAQGG